MSDKDSLISRYEEKQKHNFCIDGLAIEEQIKLPGHSWNVSALRFNNSGLYLASGSWDKSLLIWDLKILENPTVLTGNGGGHEQPITCIKWFPMIECMLISASADHSLIIWNAGNGDMLTKLVEHESWILAMSFSSDGTFLASSSWKGNVILWDMTVLKPVVQLKGHNTGIWGCAFNNDSEKILCTASEDTSLRLWDFRIDQKWHSDVILSGLHNDAIKCCCWSPCGNYVSAGSRDSKISLWDIRMNKAFNCLFGHKSDVLDVAYMSNSSSLLFSVGDTQCCLWNTFNPQGKSICSLQQHSWSYEIESLALSPDATLLATGSVDQHVSLSTIDVTSQYLEASNRDTSELPYSNMPVKTTSSSSLPKTDNGNISTAELVDQAKLLSVSKEKEKDEMIAKQTIRIKAPVTSEVLQGHINQLKNVTAADKKRQNVVTLFNDLSSMKPPTIYADDGSIRYKSKELLAEKKKLRVVNPNKKTGSKLSVKQMENIIEMHDKILTGRVKTSTNASADNSDASAVVGDAITDIGDATAGFSVDDDENSEYDFDGDDDDYDIEKVTSEMIRITVEEERNYDESNTKL